MLFFWGGEGGVRMLSILFRMKYVRYLMTFWCKFLTRILMLDFGILSLVSILVECFCMAPLTPFVMVTRGFIFLCYFVGC